MEDEDLKTTRKRAARWCATLLVAATLALPAGCKQAPVLVSGTAPPVPTTPQVARPTPTPVPAEAQWCVAAYNTLGYRLLNLAPAEGNVVLSPGAAALALDIMRMGACDDTAVQLDTALGHGTCDEAQVLASAQTVKGQLTYGSDALRSTLALGLFLGEGTAVDERSALALREELGCDMEFVDHAADKAGEAIPKWVANNTQGRVKVEQEILPQAGSVIPVTGTAMGVKLSDDWRRGGSVTRTFTCEDGKTVETPMVFAKETIPVYRCELGTLVVLPTADSQTELWLLLPPEGTTVSAFAASLNQQLVDNWRTWAQTAEYEIWMPPVDVMSAQDLAPTLGKLGFNSALLGQGDYSGLGTLGGPTQFLHAARLTTMENVPDAANGITVPQPSTEGLVIEVNQPFVAALVNKADQGILSLALVRQPLDAAAAG